MTTVVPHEPNVSFGDYLEPTWFIDSDHPEVIAMAERITSGIPQDDLKAKAIALFYDVRDRYRYNPYSYIGSLEGLKASTLVPRDESYCIPKAILLAALGRAVGIPSRLGFADVINHVSSNSLRDAMQSDIFAFHGNTEFYLDGKWLKATPAFNKGLCDKLGIAALEFDGSADAIFHPYDLQGDRFMEYVHDHGAFADMPVDLMLSTFRKHYPQMFEADGTFRIVKMGSGRFEDEATLD